MTDTQYPKEVIRYDNPAYLTLDNSIKMLHRRAGRLKTAPSSVRGILKRAWAGNSRKSGVQAFCLECQGFERNEIRNCTAFACPLYEYRPYQKGDEDEGADE